MGLFGKKSSKGDKQKEASEPGAVYVQGIGNGGEMPAPATAVANATVSDENLPVATPIEAECVAAAPPVKYDDNSKVSGYSVQPSTAVAASGGFVSVNLQNDARFGRHPCMMAACPYCGLETRTKVRTHPNFITWGMAIVLLFLFWPLCWVPLVVDRLKQTDHYCALCDKQVGTVQPFGDCFEKLRR